MSLGRQNLSSLHQKEGNTVAGAIQAPELRPTLSMRRELLKLLQANMSAASGMGKARPTAQK